MYFDYKVDIPKGKKITSNVIKGVKYISYEYGREYVKEKKYNIPKRTTIGKVCEGDENKMYPNPNFIKYFPEIGMPEEKDFKDYSSCIKVGNYIVIKKLLEESNIKELIETIIGDKAGLFLDLCAYEIISENNAAEYYPNYAYNHYLFTDKMKIYSDSSISRFLNETSKEKSVEFLNLWNRNRNKEEKIYISYDSTNKNSDAGDINIVEYGHAKDDVGKPVYNYSLAYDNNNNEPVFYEEYPGSIVDVAQLQYMLEKSKSYGYENVGFILDRGYFSKENIKYMDKCGYDFVIMVKGVKDIVSEIIKNKKGTFEEKRENSIREYQVSGITVKRQLYASDEKERYFHIYYNGQKAISERQILECKIDRMSEMLKKCIGKKIEFEESYKKYFDLVFHKDGTFMNASEDTKIIDKEIARCGYFVIITSEKMTAKEALLLYKSRDNTEKLFRGDKSYLGNKSMRVYSNESLDTKIFIEFVSLIIRNKIYRKIKEARNVTDTKINNITVPETIAELEKIEMICLGGENYKIDHALTSTQKHILKAFDIDANYFKKETEKIMTKLRYKTLATKNGIIE